ncbi:MAG: DinB family protein [Flavobacteriaceae bacterium]
MSWIKEFKKNADYRLNESWRMLQIAFEQVEEDWLWERPNGVSNSLGNQLLHMEGNMCQYLWATLGGHPDKRQRDQEFSATQGELKPLWKALEETLKKSKAVIAAASEDDLLKNYSVQAYDLSGIGLIVHAVEHFSYHTGQVAFWVKLRKAQPLGFYKGVNLNQKHDSC